MQAQGRRDQHFYLFTLVHLADALIHSDSHEHRPTDTGTDKDGPDRPRHMVIHTKTQIRPLKYGRARRRRLTNSHKDTWTETRGQRHVDRDRGDCNVLMMSCLSENLLLCSNDPVRAARLLIWFLHCSTCNDCVCVCVRVCVRACVCVCEPAFIR